MPILFDTFKQDVLKQIKEEGKKEVPQSDEEQKGEESQEKKFVEIKKLDPRNDLFQILTLSVEDFSPEREESKRRTEPIANIEDITQALILSKMGVEAQTMDYKVTALGEEELEGEEVLAYYKAPFAVSCRLSYMVSLREALEEHIGKLNDGQVTTMKQSNVLNLLRVYTANLQAMFACRIDLIKLFSAQEAQLVKNLQNSLDSLKLLDGQQDKASDDLTTEEIVQLHILHHSSRLSAILESSLDTESRADKLDKLLANLGGAIQNEQGPEAKVIKRLVPVLSTRKALKDLFEGSEAELDKARQAITQCASYLRGKVNDSIASSLASKVFENREIGINADIRSFTKDFCQELMAAYGN